MKVLLINPTLQGETFTQHLGLTSLGSYINARTNHRASILDFGFHRKNWQQYLKAKIEKEAPDVFGVTLSTPNRYAAKEIAEELSKYGRPVICGGPGATIMPEETMATMKIDALCRGEGEFTLTEWLDSLERGSDPSQISGLWLRRGQEIIKNSPRPVNPKIDELPFLDWTLWEDIDLMLSTYKILSFLGVRGCPHSCTYCSATTLREILPGFVRECDPKRYVDHIKYQWNVLKDHDFKVAWMWDQVFTTNTTWLEKFTDEYKAQGLAGVLPYAVYARADEIDEKRARLLKESGCIIVRIGFETGDRYMRHVVYEKRISDEAYKEAVRICREYGLSITGYFMLGGPGETRQTLNNTYNLVRSLKVDVPTFYVFKPLPRTRAVEKLQEFGGEVKDLWSTRVVDIRFGGMVYTPYLSPRQVELFQWKCIVSFIPGIVFRQIFRWKFKYFVELVKYISKNLGKGTSLLDLYRNFTYSCHIMMASVNKSRAALESRAEKRQKELQSKEHPLGRTT